MGKRQRTVVQVVLATVALLLSVQVARCFGLPQAAGLLCLSSLATLVICARLGWRQALLGLSGLALLAIPATLTQGDPLSATVVMLLIAFGMGLSARWQLQQVYWLMIVSVCMLITNSPFAGEAIDARDLIRLCTALLIAGNLTILLQTRLPLPVSDQVPQPLFPLVHSWRRSGAYGVLLASTSLITTPVAMQLNWPMGGL